MQLAINRAADWDDSHGFLFSVAKSQTIVFLRNHRVLPVPSLLLYGRPLPAVNEARFLGIIFDGRLPWVPYLKALRLACLRSLDLLSHLSRTTWGADKLPQLGFT